MGDEQVGRYYEDFVVGEVILSPTRRVTEQDLILFNRLTKETNPLHVDPAYAAQTRYGGLVASGSLGLSLAFASFDELRLFHGTAIAALGIDEWRYDKPLFVNAVVRGRLTILGKRRRRSTSREGIIERGIELLDADGVVLQHGRSPILVLARDDADD